MDVVYHSDYCGHLKRLNYYYSYSWLEKRTRSLSEQIYGKQRALDDQIDWRIFN